MTTASPSSTHSAAPSPPSPPAPPPPPPPLRPMPRFGWGTPRTMIFIGSEKQAWVLGPMVNPSRQIIVTAGGARINKAGLVEILKARGVQEWNLMEWDEGGIGLLIDLNATLPAKGHASAEEGKRERRALYERVRGGVGRAVRETAPLEMVVADDGSREAAAAAGGAAAEGAKVVRVHVGQGKMTRWRQEVHNVSSEERGIPGYVYFVHSHKAAGSFFSCLAQWAAPLHGSRNFDDSGNVFCSYERLAEACGLQDEDARRGGDEGHMWKPRLVPFWEWDTMDQLDLFTGPLQPSDFVANERWLGKHVVPPGTVVGHAGTLRYVTIMRDPLERAMSHYRFAGRKVNISEAEFGSRSCLRVDAGFRCWDADYHTQQLAGLHACHAKPNKNGDADSGEVQAECGKKASEAARERLAGLMSVVVVLDWIHLYPALLCQRLGWCDQEVLSWLETPAPSCRTVLDLAGHPAMMRRLQRDNGNDIELYHFAQELARQQLEASGVPPEKLGGFKYSEGGGKAASDERWRRMIELCNDPQRPREGLVQLGECSLGPGGLALKRTSKGGPAPQAADNATAPPPGTLPPAYLDTWTAVTGTGTWFKRLQEGEGALEVVRGSTVTVHATGTVKDSGFKFWSTKDAGQEAFTYQAGVGKVIRGWDQGCLGMRAGEVRLLSLPPHDAYADKGFPAWQIPPGASLLFEIQVLNIA